MIAQECYPGDSDAVESAFLHVLTDEVCTSDPVYKKFLEKMALNENRKRQRKKKTDPTSAVEKRFLKDMKKLAELRKWIRIFYSLG